MNLDIGSIIPLAAVSGYIVLIGLVALQGLDRKVNRVFIWYAFLLMMWSFGSFVMHAYHQSADVLLWDRLLVVSAAFGSVALFHFVRVFLGKSQPVALLALGYGMCALFALLTALGYTVESASYVDGVFSQELGAAGAIMWLISAFFGGAAIVSLVVGYRREKDPFDRNRIAYPLAGVGIAMALSLSNLVPSWRWYPIDHGGNMVNVALLSYAVLRYRLLDINIVFKRALLYVLQALVIAGTLIGVGTGLAAAFGGYDRIDWAPSVVVALALALIIPLLYRLMRKGIDPILGGGGGGGYRQVLRATSRAIAGMPELEDQASWLIDNIMRTIGTAKGSLFLLDEEQKRYLPKAMRGYDRPAASEMHLEGDNPVVGLLARSDRCLVADDLERVPQLRALWKLEREQLEELETRVLVPVRVKDTMIGVITLGPKSSQRAYSVDDLEFLYTVANQAGVAIENTRLYQETRDRAEWIDMINRLTKAIGSSLDIQQVYETFTATLKKLVDFDRISIGLVEGDKLKFLAVAAEAPIGLSGGDLIPLRKSGVAWVVENRCTHIERDFAQERQFPIDEVLFRNGLRSAIRLPLFYKGEVFGALNLISRQPNAYGEREQKILEQIAGQVAVATQNAMLFEQAKQSYEEAKRAYEELNTAHEYLVRSEKLRVLGEMAGGVAHDFNNVLSVILGRAQLALEDVQDPRLEKSLKAIEHAALDAAKTVRRLQDFTRVRTDQDFDQVDVSHLVKSVLQMAEPRFAERWDRNNVEISVGVDLSRVGSVRGDAAELREALMNIIFNAVDAMPDGGKISIDGWQENEKAVISIADTGTGIPDEVKSKIFDPFFSTKGREGLGLGLSVTYGIITRHGGNIDVESKSGEGSTFYVSLPLGNGDERKASSPPSPEATGKANIMLVDDDPEVSEVLELMLTQMGHQVTIVTKGEEALTLIGQSDYSLVITDLGMPDVSGWDVAKAVKQKRSATPVLLITGWGVQLDSREMAAAGVDGVIAKPFGRQALATQLARLLNGVGERTG